MTDSPSGDQYIKKDKILLPCPPSVDVLSLPPDEQVISVLSKQGGRLVLEYDLSYITKSGHGVTPTEAEAMRLVFRHNSVPVPEILLKDFSPEDGGFISKLRDIPPPQELNGLFQCAADGSLTRDPLLQDLKEPGRPLMNDSELRARIYERYIHFGDMLPQSDSCVFTHADIAPRNIMADENNEEYAQIMRLAFWGDWAVWMDRTAPHRWDISGVNAARRVLF
ncbi:hypothetical protein BGW36DRAFT_419293 [Talaromyces proteolyticus]|uniref:Aminoglycoside phosphotransferase domain-containing protein n=1 Tax=Talaromyces proteolyticus TaxID=1131652 RepID=A0AAD4PVF8_9EURO|nr:uncharacterized protein BGW36DRAFT_419293 [Talaromyces proteolyticus]KAH8693269.1 hypothetical protein BGW36DRAFT_419293 [Talaromyces proteolyticus]